eukprot:2586455-Rhodomonas_salina.1
MGTRRYAHLRTREFPAAVSGRAEAEISLSVKTQKVRLKDISGGSARKDLRRLVWTEGCRVSESLTQDSTMSVYPRSEMRLYDAESEVEYQRNLEAESRISEAVETAEANIPRLLEKFSGDVGKVLQEAWTRYIREIAAAYSDRGATDTVVRESIQASLLPSSLRKKMRVGEPQALSDSEDDDEDAVNRLRILPDSVIARVWPADRAAMGMMVCKWLRDDVIPQMSLAHFTSGKPITGAEESEDEEDDFDAADVVKTLKRVQGRISLCWRRGILQLLEVLELLE